MSVLEIKNIRKSFDGQEVLRGIDITLEKGDVLAIIGPSGNGKTTLLRCINFLETPDDGSINVNGEKIFDGEGTAGTEAEIRKKRLHFGMVFQNFNLFPQYTALENVALSKELLERKRQGCRADRRKIRAAAEAEARELLERVGLSDKAGFYPHQLSGGQQQRVAIARALASKPAIILADEPTGNLDSKTSQDVLGLLKITSEKFHQTIVMITHNEEIAQLADRIIRIEDGQIVTRE